MNAKAGLVGRHLLLDVMEKLRQMDPRTTPFDNEDVGELESSVTLAVSQVFGEDSWEAGEYGDFHIAAGHMGLSDTRSDKQAKFQAGHPRAIERLEEILEIMDRHLASEPEVLELEPDQVLSPLKTQRPARPSHRTPPAPPPAPGPKPAPAQASPPPPAKPAPPLRETNSGQPSAGAAARPSHPGTILLLRDGGDEVFLSATALLDKLAVDVVMTEGEQDAGGPQNLVSYQGLTLAIIASAPPPKGGLTGIIGKSRPRNGSVFRLGLLVGRLGAGRVAVLYSGEKPFDIPLDLYGVQYIHYKGEGGWQIQIVRFLKSAGYHVDANMLFD